MSMHERVKKALFLLYRIKWNIDIGIQQISWFAGRLPEIMAILYLAEFLGYPVPKEWAVPTLVVAVVGVAVLGKIWKVFGLYDTEVLVDTGKNPVMSEVYRAAKKINEGDL